MTALADLLRTGLVAEAALMVRDEPAAVHEMLTRRSR
jgi:hypothetical protein